MRVERLAGGMYAVRVVGELALGELLDELLECLRTLATTPADHVVIDLADVGYLDSLGVGLLVQARDLLASAELHLAGATHPAVARLLQVTGLVELFRIHPAPRPPSPRSAAQPAAVAWCRCAGRTPGEDGALVVT